MPSLRSVKGIKEVDDSMSAAKIKRVKDKLKERYSQAVVNRHIKAKAGIKFSELAVQISELAKSKEAKLKAQAERKLEREKRKPKKPKKTAVKAAVKPTKAKANGKAGK